MAVITHDESTAMFSWKDESLEEYWYCIMNSFTQLEGGDKGHRTDLIIDDDLIVDDGGDMTLFIHEIKNAE